MRSGMRRVLYLSRNRPASLASACGTSQALELVDQALWELGEGSSRSYEPAARGAQVQVLRAQVSALSRSNTPTALTRPPTGRFGCLPRYFTRYKRQRGVGRV